MGTIVIGKVESGCCKKGESLLIMPNKVTDNLLVNMSLTQNLLRGRSKWNRFGRTISR